MRGVGYRFRDRDEHRRLGPPRGRSLRDKLALLFFGITAPPSRVSTSSSCRELESNLREQQFDDLRARRRRHPGDRSTGSPPIPRSPRRSSTSAIARIADATDSRVTLLRRPGGRRRRARAASTSPATPASDVLPENLPLVREAVRTGGSPSGELDYRGEHARPGRPAADLRGRAVARRALLALARGRRRHRRVRAQRLLIGGAIALLLALIGGAVVAQALARRVRRLEVAAEDVAAGHYVEPLTDRLRGRARPADARLQRDAGAAAARRHRAARVRRDRVARAAHADLLARRLRRAAARRGGQRGGAARLPRRDRPAGRAPAEARRRPARPVAARQRIARARDRRRRPRRGGASWWPPEFGPATGEHGTELLLDLPRDGAWAHAATASGSSRSCGSCSTTPSATPRRAPPCGSAPAATRPARRSPSPTRDPACPPGKPVFDRFVTGGESQGAGLGLAIARELAGRMGGSLRASDNGGGAAFTLELPETSR